jgi:hypothetical protein
LFKLIPNTDLGERNVTNIFTRVLDIVIQMYFFILWLKLLLYYANHKEGKYVKLKTKGIYILSFIVMSNHTILLFLGIFELYLR